VEPVLAPLSYKVILSAAAPHHVARGTHPTRMPHGICQMLFGGVGVGDWDVGMGLGVHLIPNEMGMGGGNGAGGWGLG
jgi:hypothetical protein